MNIKSLLIGSAAALAAVSGAQAADAIVAAEPEPMEYVRVCDAYGTGFFYIPGTETCLRISGEVRATLSVGDRYTGNDWASAVRTRVNFDARNDSELGTIQSFIRFEGTNGGSIAVQQAWIGVGGFKVGRLATFWDDIGTTGETDAFADNSVFNAASYTYDGGAFKAGLGVDDLNGNDVGLEAFVSGSLGAATVSVWGVYDWQAEEGAVYGLVAADLGPGKFELSGAYSSGANTYVDGLRLGSSSLDNSSIEWTVAAAYTFAATEKLSITPNVSYWEAHSGRDAWGAGIFAEYKLAEGLNASATVDYFNTDDNAGGDDWSGFLRLTRSF